MSAAAISSCLYEGHVRHRRREPAHEFRYPLFMAYLDLDELPGCLDASRLWSARRPAPAWFRRSDHLGDACLPLAQALRDLVAGSCGTRPEGPVRLLTNLRYFGHCFNPVSLYYCFDPDGERVRATVAHVTNTPWGEDHAYVLPIDSEPGDGAARVLRGSLPKRLHVSPLLSMEHRYDWRLTVPGENLSVHIDALRLDGASAFDATLSLARRPLEAAEMRRVLVRYPLMTLQILARIYGQALSLRLRGAPRFARPRAGASTP